MVAPARLLLLLSCLAGHAAGAVIGIDLGSRFLKVGIIQPGVGIELVLNEATQRKSASAAGFNTMDERVYGNEAQNLLGKLPGRLCYLTVGGGALFSTLTGSTMANSRKTSFLCFLIFLESISAPAVFRSDRSSHARALSGMRCSAPTI